MANLLKRASANANQLAIESAVARIGGLHVFLERTRLTKEYAADLLAGNVVIEPDLCPEIERATRAPCEELRSDLIWHRDGAGEVIGYSAPVESNREALATSLSVNHASPILKQIFGSAEEIPSWGNVILGSAYNLPISSAVDAETAKVVSQACENLLNAIEYGVTGINDLQWVAQTHAPREVDSETTADVSFLLKHMSILSRHLRALRSGLNDSHQEMAA